MDTGIIWDEAYSEHATGVHPEAADRIATIVCHLQGSDLWSHLKSVKPTTATEDDVLLIHTPAHLQRIRRAAESGGEWLDGDTHVSDRSYEIALLAIGGALDIIGQWEQGVAPFALVRPPGHHATPDQAMGFCLFNNIAITAATLLEQGMERVAIVDWDVHHGNGTQDAFYADPRVLFVSMHEWPHYPGTGWIDECGSGAGKGFTVNVPLPSKCGDGDYGHAFDEVVIPVVRQFAPEALLVSAGQDVHADDPLGGMALTEAGFGHMAGRLAGLAREVCDGRLGFVLEGGYDPRASARSVEAVLRAVIEESVPAVGPAGIGGVDAVARAAGAQKPFWTL